PEVYYRYFNALPLFTDPALAKRTLDYAASPAARSQDSATLIGGLLASAATNEMAWEFTRSHWPALLRKLDIFEGVPNVFGSLSGFCSASRATEIRDFFAKSPEPAIRRTLQVALERIDSCVALDARQSKPFSTWLNAVGTN